MYKLAVFDLDGTLLKSDYSLSELHKKAVTELKNKGVKVVLASGRPNELMKEYVKELRLDTPVVSCNGSVIYNHETKETLYSKAIPKQIVTKIYQYAKDNEIDLLLYGTGFIASNFNERYRFFTKRNQELPVDVQGNFILVDGQEEEILSSDINKILFIEKDRETYFNLLDELSLYDSISVTRSKEEFIDIGPLDISKGEAVKKLALYYNLTSTQIIAFGDQYNDVPMLQYAGLGVAMGNAIEDVKKEANDVALSNQEDGIYHYLKKIEKMGQL